MHISKRLLVFAAFEVFGRMPAAVVRWPTLAEGCHLLDGLLHTTPKSNMSVLMLSDHCT